MRGFYIFPRFWGEVREGMRPICEIKSPPPGGMDSTRYEQCSLKDSPLGPELCLDVHSHSNNIHKNMKYSGEIEAYLRMVVHWNKEVGKMIKGDRN